MVMTAAAGRCVVGCRVDQKWDIKPLYDRLERKKKGELDETMVEKAQSMPFTPREPSGHSLREFVLRVLVECSVVSSGESLSSVIYSVYLGKWVRLWC
jgi:hypothetical protein